MVKIGNYFVEELSECFRIFPKNKNGDTIPLIINRKSFILRHISGDLVVIKRYTHRGKLMWSDSRVTGSCDRSHIINEVTRMLFSGNRNKAIQLINGENVNE